jgi:hypothetical protein
MKYRMSIWRGGVINSSSSSGSGCSSDGGASGLELSSRSGNHHLGVLNRHQKTNGCRGISLQIGEC